MKVAIEIFNIMKLYANLECIYYGFLPLPMKVRGYKESASCIARVMYSLALSFISAPFHTLGRVGSEQPPHIPPANEM